MYEKRINQFRVMYLFQLTLDLSQAIYKTNTIKFISIFNSTIYYA